MKCGPRGQYGSIETGPHGRVNIGLRNATWALLLTVASFLAVQQAAADPGVSEQQKKSRSNFEYHDGRAEERRLYRRPDLDVDPTNLKLEELRERINALEERLERLEYQQNGFKRGR